MPNNTESIKRFLDEKVLYYNQPSFIENDPISIPHLFSKKQDIEIAGFFASVLAWGIRTTIIKNSKKLMSLMDNSPYDFILNHKETDLKPFLNFVHRTFNSTDLLYFISFLKHHYTNFNSLEDAFVSANEYNEANVKEALINFQRTFFSLEHLQRTRKHISTPEKNSACKRLNMYLRWMVRKDNTGVDFGIWNKIKPYQLIIPLDVHVARVSYKLGLLPENKANWNNAEKLTSLLKEMNNEDPVIYDFALFSIGVDEN